MGASQIKKKRAAWLPPVLKQRVYYRKRKTQYSSSENVVEPIDFLKFVSSDRSSCTDDGLLYIQSTHLFRFGAFMPFYTVTSVTLSRLNSINAIDVTGYLGDIFGIFSGYFWDIFGIFLEYFWDILGIFWGYFWYILEIFWRYFGDILGIFWGFFEDILGIF